MAVTRMQAIPGRVAPAARAAHITSAAPVDSRPRSARCRAAEINAGLGPAPHPTTLLDTWVHEEVQASLLSFEGDFVPSAIWPNAGATTTAPVMGTASQPRTTVEASSAAKDRAPQPALQHPLLAEAQRLEALIDALRLVSGNAADQVTILLGEQSVQAFLHDVRHAMVVRELYALPAHQQLLLLSLLAMGQHHVLTLPETGERPSVAQVQARLGRLVASLQRVHQFYDSIGGLLGYQARSLRLIIAGTEEAIEKQQATDGTAAAPTQAVAGGGPGSDVSYHVPQALDLAGEEGREVGARMAAAGLAALPRMAEIYPLGGAGDRLGLKCEETGECLPAAMLPYCGRTMLEGLMRDLAAREYLHYRLTGQQVTIPVAIMSSEAKGNHARLTALMDRFAWFGRGQDAFRIFQQPLVPVISVADGAWLLSDALRPMTKPGGHGAIWKLMWDEGVFAWLKEKGRTAALVRQISNPMAGMDTTLLALAGCGTVRPGAAFGFMSCDRTIGAAEGCNVLQEQRVRTEDGRVRYRYGYTNIEYTEFERLGISDQAVAGSSRRSVFPANTNVLYVGLGAAEAVVAAAVEQGCPDRLMPGLIFNLKKVVQYNDPLGGGSAALHAGRMECTMQNLADHMMDERDAPLAPAAAADQLSTFLVYNMRRKVTSSAKKRRQPGSTRISQTPDGSFYDLQRNAWHLLQQCGLRGLPELGSVEQYLEHGPGFIFLYHPALGPLWDVISQKVVGGSLAQGSEVVLEVAEARLVDLHVNGSLLIHADRPLGHSEGEAGDPRLVYSAWCGRVNMTNVRVDNAGVDWAAPDNVYWKHHVARKEAVQIILRGQSEFEAHDVTLAGSHVFEVPDGFRMVVTQDAAGCLRMSLSPVAAGSPTWQWVYRMLNGGQVRLEYVRHATAGHLPASTDVWLRSGRPPPPAPMPALSTSGVAGTGGRWSDDLEVSGAGAATALTTSPSRLRLLQQLQEIDIVLDFTI